MTAIDGYIELLQLCNSHTYDPFLADMQRRCLEALYELLSDDNYISKYMSSDTEERYNHNHDPHTGRFTSGNGVDNGGESGIIKETENQKLLNDKIKSGELPLKINQDKQARHILQNGETSKPDGRSYLTIGLTDAQLVIDEYHATGDVVHVPSSNKFKELITTKKEIGVDGRSNRKTNQAFINYSKTGTHIVPTKKGRKDD